VPLLDGTDRAGVLRIGLDDSTAGRRTERVVDDAELRHWLWILAGLIGHILMTKIAYSDRLRRWRSNGPLSPAAELLWQLLPPRTFATDRVVVSAILEPTRQVAGDAYDYNVDGDSRGRGSSPPPSWGGSTRPPARWTTSSPDTHRRCCYARDGWSNNSAHHRGRRWEWPGAACHPPWLHGSNSNLETGYCSIPTA
jgi:hypothetical protein